MGVQKIKVLVFGTFDLLHPGHEFFLKKAKKYGNILGAVVARDKTVLKIKKHLPRQKEQERKANLEKLDYLDQVFLGDLLDKYKVILKFQPDIICLGYDQEADKQELKKELSKRGLNNLKIIKFRKSFKSEIYKSSKMSFKIEKIINS